MGRWREGRKREVMPRSRKEGRGLTYKGGEHEKTV